MGREIKKRGFTMNLKEASQTLKTAEKVYSDNDGQVGPGVCGKVLDTLSWALKEVQRLNGEIEELQYLDRRSYN